MKDINKYLNDIKKMGADPIDGLERMKPYKDFLPRKTSIDDFQDRQPSKSFRETILGQYAKWNEDVVNDVRSLSVFVTMNIRQYLISVKATLLEIDELIDRVNDRAENMQIEETKMSIDKLDKKIEEEIK
ncbi:hypothetical protein SNEBB_006045 [Seison nebaliae]|nr:hypothetical protein SNEBB_006045 [Seison nebaliae]